MAPGRFRPWLPVPAVSIRTMHPSQGLRLCGRAAFPSVLLHAVFLIHTFGPTVYSANRFTASTEPSLGVTHLRLPCPCVSRKGTDYPCPCMLRRHDTGLRLTQTQRSSRQVNTPSEEQWNCR